MTSPIGPIDSGHVEEVVVTDAGVDYLFAWYADANNEELQEEGKPPKFWRAPLGLRMARDPTTEDLLFTLVHYVGVRGEATHIGDTRDLAGGRLAFTVTTDPPEGVVGKAEEKLRQRLREQNPGGKYWRLHGRNAHNPTFGLVPMTNARIHVMNLGVDAKTGNSNVDTRALPGVPRIRLKDNSQPIPESRLARRDMLDDLSELLWAQLDGQGDTGGIGGPKSFAGNISNDLAGILWKDFEQGATSTLGVTMTADMELYFPAMELTIEGDWERVFDHFSAAANFRSWWFDADVEVEFEKMVTNGTLDIDVTIDGTKPGADELEEYVNERITFISQQFMEQAKKNIFEPAPPDVEPAKANAKNGFFAGLFGGGGFALKKKYERRELHLGYHETRQVKYLKPHTITGQLQGFFNEIQKDPKAQQKYFVKIDLTDWARKVYRVLTPVANWPSPEREYIGDPVEAIFVAAGYPNADGNIDWDGFKFTADGPEDWIHDVARKEMNQVSNPPEGWKPDKMYVRRRVILEEPGGESDSRFVKQYVEKNEFDLDPEEGTLTEGGDVNLTARADSVGKFEIGPLKPFVGLEHGQSIELELKPLGETHEGEERPSTRFVWTGADTDQETQMLKSGYYERYTGEKDEVPKFRYRVTVRTMGTIFSRGEEWTGPWVDVEGNGELLFNVPLKEDVDPRNVRRLSDEEHAEGLYAIARRRRGLASGTEAGPPAEQPPEESPTITTGDAGTVTSDDESVSGTPVSRSDISESGGSSADERAWDDSESDPVWPESQSSAYQDE